MFVRSLCLISAVIILSACNGLTVRNELADKLALAGGLEKGIIDTGHFRIMTYQRSTDDALEAIIYIEGDGLAFVSRNRASLNPTPTDPVSLRLAVLDKSKSVFYIARPCQYVPMQENPACNMEYWTISRYAPKIIESINKVLDILKEKYGFTRIQLVGFSGGASIAAILAATRDDVVGLRTLAGNLDIDMFARVHDITPLQRSLNPVDYAAELARIPQLHLLGSEDEIIVSRILDSYLDKLKVYDPELSCVDTKILDGISHTEGWIDAWTRYVSRDVACNISE